MGFRKKAYFLRVNSDEPFGAEESDLIRRVHTYLPGRQDIPPIVCSFNDTDNGLIIATYELYQIYHDQATRLERTTGEDLSDGYFIDRALDLASLPQARYVHKGKGGKIHVIMASVRSDVSLDHADYLVDVFSGDLRRNELYYERFARDTNRTLQALEKGLRNGEMPDFRTLFFKGEPEQVIAVFNSARSKV